MNGELKVKRHGAFSIINYPFSTGYWVVAMTASHQVAGASRVGWADVRKPIVKAAWAALSLRDGTHDSPKYKDNGIPLVTSKNIVNDFLDLSDVSLISVNDANEINKRSTVELGDIIMSMIGTIGSAVLIFDEPRFCIKNVALFKPKKVRGEFLIQMIRSTTFQDYLEDSLDGGIQKFVSLGTLRSLELALPNEEEQTAIAAILSDMDTEIQTQQQRLSKTRQIKQGMMQELLTGKIRLIKPEPSLSTSDRKEYAHE